MTPILGLVSVTISPTAYFLLLFPLAVVGYWATRAPKNRRNRRPR